MSAITPTPGRIVWYWPSPNDNIPALPGQPLAAIVASVHSLDRINLSVIDAYGHHHSRQNVLLVQDDETSPANGYAEWMPYQKGQAAKAEKLEEQLQGGNGPFADVVAQSASVTGFVSSKDPEQPEQQ